MPAGVDFTQGLAEASLKGVRIGVLHKRIGSDPRVAALFEQALGDLKAGRRRAGRCRHHPPTRRWGATSSPCCSTNCARISAPICAAPPADIPVRSLADVIAFDKAHAVDEMRWFGQDVFEQAEQATDKAAYQAARANSLRLAGPEGIDKLLTDNNVRFLVSPTEGPAWTSDLVNGDHFSSGIGLGSLAAIAGYPHLTVRWAWSRGCGGPLLHRHQMDRP